LDWRDDHGFLAPTEQFPYDQAYFDRYATLATTEMGRRITEERAKLVVRFTREDADVLDIGVGCGAFLNALRGQRECVGFDVNPAAIDWLKREAMWVDRQLHRGAAALTFWDSLEHIVDPWSLVSRAQEEVFLSIPIFRDRAHVLASKHFKPNEHIWYFTHDGLVRAFQGRGFYLAHESQIETELGREDISTFVFRRL
jgi:predicted RNA methylase